MIMHNLSLIIWLGDISLVPKLCLYTILYASVTWADTALDLVHLHVFHIKCQRQNIKNIW